MEDTRELHSRSVRARDEAGTVESLTVDGLTIFANSLLMIIAKTVLFPFSAR